MVPCWGGPDAEQLPVETQLLLLELQASGAGGCMKTAEAAACASLCASAHPRRCLPPASHISPPSPTHHLHPKPAQDGSYGLLAPLIDGDSFRASIRPPRPRRDPPGSVLLRLESGDESAKAKHFGGEEYYGRKFVAGVLTDGSHPPPATRLGLGIHRGAPEPAFS